MQVNDIEPELKQLIRSQKLRDILDCLVQLCQDQADILEKSCEPDENGHFGSENEDVQNLWHVADRLKGVRDECYV